MIGPRLLVCAITLVLTISACGSGEEPRSASGPPPAAPAGGITLEDVVRLKELGFSDAEVVAEVERAGGRLSVGEEEIKRLQAAGAGKELLDHLRAAAPRKLAAADVVKLVGGGATVEEVLAAIAESGSRFDLEPSAAVELGRQGVPLAVLLAMKGRKLAPDDLRRLAGTGLSADGFGRLLTITGFRNDQLTPASALELLRAGVPDEVVARCRGGAPAATPGPSGALREYRHAGGYFVLRYPADWHLVRCIDQGALVTAVTPERGRAQWDEMDAGVQLGLVPLSDSLLGPRKDPVGVLTHLLPLLRQGEPGLVPVGGAESARMGGQSGARVRFRGTIREKEGTFVTELCLTRREGLTYILECRAPEAAFEELEPAFRRIREESVFTREKSTRRATPYAPSEIVDRYRESVVSIVAHHEGKGSMTGTGFVIHEDGYVATNAHVVLDQDQENPATSLTVEWDQSLERKPVQAETLGWVFKMTGMKHHHGVDVALIKLPPGKYRAMPLTRLENVRLGDPVVTMGFPVRSEFGTLNLHVTGGVMTRFNRNPTGSVESMFMDAKITHGNSGGPCISLVTGGVVGLNTFGQDIRLDPRLERLNYLVGYFGVVPTDALRTAFPLVADFGGPFEPDFDFYDSYGLASLLAGRGSPETVRSLADRACRLRPDSADALNLKASCAYRQAGDAPQVRQALALYERALALDPDHLETILALGWHHLGGGNFLEATKLADRATEANPGNWRGHQFQAEVLFALKRFDESLAAAERAKDRAGGILAEPSVLAGRILYRQGKLEAGRDRFAEASRIHPSNLTARFGVCEYYERKKNYESALVEYRRLEEEFEGHPVVMGRVARCYRQLGRFDDAWKRYDAAFQATLAGGKIPSEDLFFEMGSIAWDVRRDLDLTVTLYRQYLYFYGDSPRAAAVNLTLARLFRDAGPARAGLAYGHLSRARALSPDREDIAKELEKEGLRPMSVADIGQLLNGLRYHPRVVADIVRATRLDIRLDPENAGHRELLRKHRIPMIVATAMVQSNRQHGVAEARAPAPAAGAGGAEPRKRPPEAGGGEKPPPREPKGPKRTKRTGNPQATAALVGTWTGTYRWFGMSWKVRLTFNADGTYHRVSVGETGENVQGSFVADRENIYMTAGGVGERTVEYRLGGNRITLIGMTGFTSPLTLTKQ